MRRAKRARRARDVRERLEAEARQLMQEAHRLHTKVYWFERDHLDRSERATLDRALAALHEAGEALYALTSRLGRAARRRA